MARRAHARWLRRLVLITVAALLTAGVRPVGIATAGEPSGDALVVAGQARVGGTLAVEDPQPDVVYQWYRGGRPIPDATGAEYAPVAADAGQALWVRTVAPDAEPALRRSRLLLVRPDWEQRIVAWDTEDASPAAAIEDAVAIAVGGDHSLALRADGTLAAWGGNDYGQLDVPAGLRDVVGITAGNRFSVALRSDGTVIAWGSNANGRATPPEGLDQVVAIASGQAHTLAVRADGTVAAWGFGSTPPFTQTQVPSGLVGVVAVAAGANHSLALKADGSVVGWGYNYSGAATPPADLSDVVAIDGSSEASIALHSDGTMTEWGFTSSEFPTGTTVTAVASNYHRTIALRPDGTVIGWPYLSYGVTDVPTSLKTATAVATNEHASLALARVWTGSPVVTGTARLGGTLTADPGDWVPGATLSYQWLRDGKPITAATAARYRLTGKDVGSRISVRVTGKLDHYTIRSATSARTAKVMKAGVPSVRGTRATGSTLTATRGTWTAKTTFSYQWLRDGKPIRKATKSTYRLTRADAGHRISVAVTGRQSGYASVTATSAHTTRILKVATPQIKGIRSVGRLLRAEPGAWTPSAGLTYRWYANGRVVQSSRSPYLWATASLRGQRIRVTVTGRRSGYATITRSSTLAGPIR